MSSVSSSHTSDTSDLKRHAARSTPHEQEAPADPGFVGAASVVQLERPGQPPMQPNQVRALQRAIGNQTTARMMGGLVRRHTEGTELPAKEDQVGEIQEKEQAAPQATRTKTEEAAQTSEAKKAGSAFQKSQKLTPGAMSLASAQKVLQGAFGGLKTIVPGTIVILADQPACSAKYDEVCMADGIKRPDGSDWQAGDCAKDDAAAGTQTEGFAWKGVVYVNGKTTLVTATAHEILHNNTAAGFRTKVGETFNEGATELLARRALGLAGVAVPTVTAYPDQVKFTLRLQQLVGQDTLSTAYFSGPDSLVTRYEELKGVGTWATLKGFAEALDETQFNAAIGAKKGK